MMGRAADEREPALDRYAGTYRWAVRDIVSLHSQGMTTVGIAKAIREGCQRPNVPNAQMVFHILGRLYPPKLELMPCTICGTTRRIWHCSRCERTVRERNGRVIDMGGQDGLWHEFVLGPECWR